ncbi:MAG: DegT/DnrJ/EryC1/StrS family aminotransferase [Elusimicrobia bacterium]|nr:DegT/DnrJ/EryC1/StrS family aminotransferase [Elusimicrobiota bacterium]
MTTTKLAVPYTAFKQEASVIKEELSAAFDNVLESGRYIMGPELATFEREFGEICQTKFALGVDNGTSALFLVLRSLGLKNTDEVITAPNSFLASASSIALAGARPAFADVGRDGNIDPARLEDAIGPRTKAVMPVHLTGRPARMPEILEIAKRHNLFVLEDAAQAVGASLNGRPVGSWGDAASFSLHPLKNLHALGDGGMIATSSQDLYNDILKARNHGLRDRETSDFWSYNCRLDELQAAFLRVQARYLEEWTQARREKAFRYNELLRPYVEVPEEGQGERCVYQTYVIRAERRDALVQYLRDNGVEALVHYRILIPLQPAARELGYSANDFPEAARQAERIISLPIYSSLTEEQQDYVAELIRSFYA